MMLPIPLGLFAGPPSGILPHRLRDRRRRGEPPPRWGRALRRRTRRGRLAALLVLPVLRMRLGPLGRLAQCARLGLVARHWRHRRAPPHPAWHQGLVGPPTAQRCRRPLSVHQPPCCPGGRHHRRDPGHRDPVAPASPPAAVRAPLAPRGKQPGAREPASRYERPAHAGRDGRLQLLDERQGRGPAAPLGPGIRDARPADGERAPRADAARPPDCPGPAPGRVECHDGLGRRQAHACQADQRGTDRGLRERRSMPPPSHPSSARPAGASRLSRPGTGQCGGGDVVRAQATPHRPRDRGHDRGVRIAEPLLDPSRDRRLSSLDGRHNCALLQAGGGVTSTGYDDRMPMSSGYRWPLPRGYSLSAYGRRLVVSRWGAGSRRTCRGWMVHGRPEARRVGAPSLGEGPLAASARRGPPDAYGPRPAGGRGPLAAAPHAPREPAE